MIDKSPFAKRLNCILLLNRLILAHYIRPTLCSNTTLHAQPSLKINSYFHHVQHHETGVGVRKVVFTQGL